MSSNNVISEEEKNSYEVSLLARINVREPTPTQNATNPGVCEGVPIKALPERRPG